MYIKKIPFPKTIMTILHFTFIVHIFYLKVLNFIPNYLCNQRCAPEFTAGITVFFLNRSSSICLDKKIDNEYEYNTYFPRK